MDDGELTGYGNVYLSENNGTGSYKGLTFTAARISDTGFGFQSSLTFSKAEDINGNERITNGGVSVTNNPANPGANLAPSDSDAKFRGVFTGYFPVIYGIQGAVTLQYQSWPALLGYIPGKQPISMAMVSPMIMPLVMEAGIFSGSPPSRYLDLALKRSWNITPHLPDRGRRAGLQRLQLGQPDH